MTVCLHLGVPEAAAVERASATRAPAAPLVACFAENNSVAAGNNLIAHNQNSICGGLKTPSETRVVDNGSEPMTPS